MEHDITVYKKEPGLVFIASGRLLDFCYTSKSKLFNTLNGFIHGLGPKVWRPVLLLSILGFVLYKESKIIQP